LNRYSFQFHSASQDRNRVATLPNHEDFSIPFTADFNGGFYENRL
jgi:hypothetical protein